MKKILMKYLTGREQYTNLVQEIITNNLDSKATFDFVAKNTDDRVVKMLYNIANVGVFESIDALRISPTFGKPMLSNKLNYIQKLASVNEDTQVLPQYLQILSENSHDPVFKRELKIITDSLNPNKRKLALCSFYLNMDANAYLSKTILEAKEILFDMIITDNEINESRFLNLASKLNYNKDIQNIVNYLSNSKSGLTLEHDDFIVQNVSGVLELVEENVFILHTEGRNLVINDNENTVSDLTDDSKYIISKDFHNLSKLLDSKLLTLSEVINIHANKVLSINENKKTFIDGKEIVLVENNFDYTIVEKYGIDKKYLPTIKYVMEHFDSFVSFDNAKKIQHKENKDINAIVFNMNENLFAFKNNAKVATKYLVESYTANELRSELLEFLNFDIKKSIDIFESIFIKESQTDKKRVEILKQIEQLEAELEKIENAENNEGLEDESITELKKIINEKINDLRKEHIILLEKGTNLDDYIEVEIKGKKGTYYVNALDYTKSGKNEDVTVKDENGEIFSEMKKNIITLENI